MVDWSELSARMDAAVDEQLGDTLRFSTNGGTSYVDQQGFVLVASLTSGIIGMDEPLGSKPRVKLPRDLFGAAGVPGRNIRIKHARLGPGTFRPAGGEPENQGRYILFDVQKV